MESSQLYTEIENFIRRNLQQAYNKNTPKVQFHLADSFPDSKKIHFNNFSINLGDRPLPVFKQSRWRIPQTRIYFEFAVHRDVKITELKYFDTSVILIRSYSNKDIKLKMLYNQPKENTESVLIFPFQEKIIFCGKSFSEPNIIRALNEILNEEKSLNPVNKIFSTQNDLLTSIDQSWADIPWESAKQPLKLAGRDKNMAECFAVLFSELSIYMDGEYSNFNRLQPLQDIQYIWNILSLPAFKYKAIEMANADCHQLVLFLSGAFAYNFWWADKARIYFHEIVQNFQPEIEPLFNMVFLLKSHGNISKDKQGLMVSGLKEHATDTTCAFDTRLCQMKFVQSKQESYSYFTFNDLKTIAVNKKVRCLYNNDKKTIEIQPQTFQYKLHSLNKWVIQVDATSIEVPLVWKEFTFFYGDLRIKFLFKKNRYQISIKGNKSIKDLWLNDQKINFESSKYLKKYFTVPKLTLPYNIYFSDSLGRVQEKNNVTDPCVLNIIAQSSYGHILPNLHVRKIKSKKNIRLNPPGSELNKLTAPAGYEVIIPKTAVVKLDTEFRDSYLNKLLLSPATILQEKLCIFAEEKSLTERLRTEFAAVFGFQPFVQLLSKINQTFNTENIVISNISLGEEKIKQSLYSEIILKKGGQKRALLFNEQNFIKWLKAMSSH